MKMSNKLILGLVAFIGLYIVAAFAEIRIKGWPYGEVVRVDHVTNLSDFSYVKIDSIGWRNSDGRNLVNIKIMEQSACKVQTFEGDQIPELKYHMEADTLVIDQFQNVGRSKLQINANKRFLKGIVAIWSNVNLLGQLDSLELTLKDYANLNWGYGDKPFNTTYLQVSANNSFMQTSKEVNIENLQVDNSKSHLRIHGNTQNLTGSIKDTKLHLKQVVNMSVSKDSLSEIDRNFKF